MNPSTGRTSEVDPSKLQRRVKRVRRVGLSYAAKQGVGPQGRLYEAPLFNLEEVRIASEVDSFVRRAVQRHVDLFIKAGYFFDGNPKAVRYLRKRFAIMAALTKKPFDVFIEECVEDFIKYHNIFLIKGRLRPGETFPGMRARPVSDKTAISGYFKIPAATISVARTRIGNSLIMWMQTVGQMIPFKSTFAGTVTGIDRKNPNKILIAPRNMVHIYKNREEGEVFGTPFLLPCIPDVKTLREVEQYVIEMVYQFANPIVKWQVGTKESPGEKADIDQAIEEAIKGPIAGTFIIPGNQDISVAAASEGIDVMGPLGYFENRVFTGLGTSQTQMGRGDTANRSTSKSMDDSDFDRIRGYHKTFTASFNEYVVYEILMEGGFDPFNEKEVAKLVFHDPDVGLQVVQENSAVQLYTNFIVTEDEARARLGMDPLTEKERKNNFFFLVKKPLVEATALARVPTGSPSNGNGAQKSNSSKLNPSNQHGKGTVKKSSEMDFIDAEYTEVADNYGVLPERVSIIGIAGFVGSIESLFRDLKKDVLSLISREFSLDSKDLGIKAVGLYFRAAEDLVQNSMSKELWPQFRTGLVQAADDLKRTIPPDNKFGFRFKELLNIYGENWKSFHQDLYNKIGSSISEAKDRFHATTLAAGVFDSMEYIVRFRGKSYFYHARNTGYGWAAHSFGEETLVVKHFGTCPKCDKVDRVTLAGFSPDKVPPASTHPNCECEVQVVERR